MTRVPKDAGDEGGATRAFIAVQLPADVKVLIAAHVERLKGLVPRGVRWVDPQAAHLTLAFLGNVPDSQLPTLSRIVGSIAAAFPPIRLETGPLGAFPNPRRPRVLWLGLHGDAQALSRIQGCLQDALETEGFPTERRAFKPHVTLGRARGRGVVSLPCADLDRPPANGRAFEVREIVLMSSALTPRGPIHTPLKTAPLSRH